MNLTIVGAGIGGLTAAVALARDGNKARVLEQTPHPKPVGAGISLQPNAMKALARLGLDDKVTQRGCNSSPARFCFRNGNSVQELDFSTYVDRYGYLPQKIHRAGLFDLLFEAATESGVEVCFGEMVEAFEANGSSVTVATDTGQIKCDALIGADGISSRVRSQLWGEQPVRFSGYVCWRGIVIEPRIVDSIKTISEYWGMDARFGFMRCSEDKVYWFATKTTAIRARPDESWRKHSALGTIRFQRC